MWCYLTNLRISLTKIAVALFGTRSHYAPPHVAHGAKVRVLRGVNKCPPREAMSDAVLRRVLRKKPRDTRSGEPWVRGNAAAMRQLSLTAALLAVALVLRVEPARADLDWHALGEEAATLLSDLIRVDTTNPPGGETAAANLLARKFRAEGIETEVMESAPGRGNLYARLPGQGGARPLILLSHLDVVPADPRDWRIAPFGGIRERGHIYGRGALDAKGLSVIQAMAVIALKRSHRPPGRDVIVLATADEETGGAAGAGWLVHHRRELLGNAEYLLTEGDHIHLRGGRKIVQVSVAEKTPCWLKLVAHGESGHGSTPPRFTAVTRLIRALNKIRRYRTPISLVPAVESYFAAFAPLEKEPLRGALTHLHDALEEPQFLADFTRNPRQNALIRDTITPTVLQGSSKTNVIPAEASAQLDCRLLPGEDPAAFIAQLRSVIGDDAVAVETLLSFPASSSDPSSPLITAVRQLAAADLGGAPVVPSVIPGFTDSHYFREQGVASYGFIPFVLTEEEEKTVHGSNERVSIQNLENGVRRLVMLLHTLPSAAPR